MEQKRKNLYTWYIIIASILVLAIPVLAIALRNGYSLLCGHQYSQMNPDLSQGLSTALTTSFYLSRLIGYSVIGMGMRRYSKKFRWRFLAMLPASRFVCFAICAFFNFGVLIPSPSHPAFSMWLGDALCYAADIAAAALGILAAYLLTKLLQNGKDWLYCLLFAGISLILTSLTMVVNYYSMMIEYPFSSSRVYGALFSNDIKYILEDILTRGIPIGILIFPATLGLTLIEKKAAVRAACAPAGAEPRD